MKCWRLKTKKTESEKLRENLTCFVLSFCRDGGVRWAGSTQKADLSRTVKTLTTKSLCLSVWGIPTLATAEEERDGPSSHGDRVALWRSAVTADEVTQNCFEKIYAQFYSFIMAIEGHSDLNQLFEEPLLEAFRYFISFAFCRRKRSMKTGSLKSFHTNPHILAKKFAPEIYRGLAWPKCHCAISL